MVGVKPSTDSCFFTALVPDQLMYCSAISVPCDKVQVASKMCSSLRRTGSEPPTSIRPDVAFPGLGLAKSTIAYAAAWAVVHNDHATIKQLWGDGARIDGRYVPAVQLTNKLKKTTVRQLFGIYCAQEQPDDGIESDKWSGACAWFTDPRRQVEDHAALPARPLR